MKLKTAPPSILLGYFFKAKKYDYIFSYDEYGNWKAFHPILDIYNVNPNTYINNLNLDFYRCDIFGNEIRDNIIIGMPRKIGTQGYVLDVLTRSGKYINGNGDICTDPGIGLFNSKYFSSYNDAYDTMKRFEKYYPLRYNNYDIGKIFAKEEWQKSGSGKEMLKFSWNQEQQQYQYCKIVDGKIVFNALKTQGQYKNVKTLYSRVGDDILDSKLIELEYTIKNDILSDGLVTAVDLSNANDYTTIHMAYDNSLCTTGVNLTNKIYEENTMKETKEVKITKEDILKVLCEGEAKVEEKPKTDLERRTRYHADIYTHCGKLDARLQFESKDEAETFLQYPANIGKTVVLYKEILTYTTDIPVVKTKA